MQSVETMPQEFQLYKMRVLIDGNSLTPELLVQLSHGDTTIDLSPEAWEVFDGLFETFNFGSEFELVALW